MASNVPYFAEFFPQAQHVPPVQIAAEVMMPLILSRFDTLERMVLGLYQNLANPSNGLALNPVKDPHVAPVPPSEPSSARPRKPVPIVPPADPRSSVEHSASGTPEPKECDSCHQPFNPTNPKWKICDDCDAAKRSEARNKKLRKGKIPCDTENCTNTVSPNSASGLCHVCWWKSHIKCAFCPGTLRSSEESHICSRCRNRFRTWHRISGKNGYRVTEQSGQVGRLFSKGGRFEPFSDQEEATAKLSRYREFIRITEEDEIERSNSASRRRADRLKERETTSEKALDKWKSGLTVTFVPTEHEALQDANASCPEESSIFPVTHIAHDPQIPGMSRAPPIIGSRKPQLTYTVEQDSSATEAEFPFSSGVEHSKFSAMMSGTSSDTDSTFRPSGRYPSAPSTAKRSSPDLSSDSLLPSSEKFRTTRPGAAIPIVTPPEIRESLFPLVPPTATRTKPTTVSSPLAKDRGSGIDDTFASAPSPALVQGLTTSSDVTLKRVVPSQLPVDSEFASEELGGGTPKVPKLRQPFHTAAINAGEPSLTEATALESQVTTTTKSSLSNVMGLQKATSDQVTLSSKPDLKRFSELPHSKVLLERTLTKSTLPIGPPSSLSPKVTSIQFGAVDVRKDPPHFLVDDFTCCTQMCSIEKCLRSGFDKHCVIQAHSGTAHRCDLCWKSYPIEELRTPPQMPPPQTLPAPPKRAQMPPAIESKPTLADSIPCPKTCSISGCKDSKGGYIPSWDPRPPCALRCTLAPLLYKKKSQPELGQARYGEGADDRNYDVHPSFRHPKFYNSGGGCVHICQYHIDHFQAMT